MTDNYPTRKEATGRFIIRKEPTSYSQYFPLYNQYGYGLLKGYFSKREIEECQLSCHSAKGLVTNEPGQQVIRSVTGVHLNEPFKSLATHDSLVSLIRRMLGSEIYIHQSRINYKEAISGSGWAWHSDFETWHAQDGMPTMRCLTAMIPLTENTNCNGSLMVIPKSHELFYACKKEEEVSAEDNFAYQKEGVPDRAAILKFFEHSNDSIDMITCSPGDLFLFDCNTIHVSTQNLSSKPRTNLFFVYNSIENKLVDPFTASKPRPEEMGTRETLEVIH
jgi:ectoine hydroxylase